VEYQAQVWLRNNNVFALQLVWLTGNFSRDRRDEAESGREKLDAM